MLLAIARGMTDVVPGKAGVATIEVYRDERSLLTSASSKIAHVKDFQKHNKK